jgi:hypothetical protein
VIKDLRPKNGLEILSVEIFISDTNKMFGGRCLVRVTLLHQPQQEEMVKPYSGNKPPFLLLTQVLKSIVILLGN